MTTSAKKALDVYDYASSSMEMNTSTVSNKRDRETPTKIPGPVRKKKTNDDDSPSFDCDREDEVSNAAIFKAVKSLTSMVESFNSRLQDNTLAIANLAKSLDFYSRN